MAETTSDRLLNVLGLFTTERPEWTVESAARELDLAVSTAYRYFRSLTKAGLIVASVTGRYVLGPAIIQYDRQIRLLDPVLTSAQPIMTRLAQQLPLNVILLLCRLFRNQVICVHQEARERTHFATSYERGRPMPLFRGAASKIILAHMPPRTVKALYLANAEQFKHASLGSSWDEVKPRLREFRSAGVAITRGELDPGMVGVAVAVFDHAEAVIGSLSLVLEQRHLTQKFVETATQQLRAASAEITWALSLLASGHSAAAQVQQHASRARGPAKTGASAPRRTRSPQLKQKKAATR